NGRGTVTGKVIAKEAKLLLKPRCGDLPQAVVNPKAVEQDQGWPRPPAIDADRARIEMGGHGHGRGGHLLQISSLHACEQCLAAMARAALAVAPLSNVKAPP